MLDRVIVVGDCGYGTYLHLSVGIERNVVLFFAVIVVLVFRSICVSV